MSTAVNHHTTGDDGGHDDGSRRSTNLRELLA